jgi:hypothetical protein
MMALRVERLTKLVKLGEAKWHLLLELIVAL